MGIVQWLAITALAVFLLIVVIILIACLLAALRGAWQATRKPTVLEQEVHDRATRARTHLDMETLYSSKDTEK
ncbi:hypothetical protein [Actinobaculum massiliense]|uniref:hypothetical protein n=1 Tax=Actinobaculum massiliense TaxID=202789 RepID=UPI00071AF1C9|nr:hypothetical protein [Actinobaculum massiliense]